MNNQLNDDRAESIVAMIGQLAVLPREEALARVREVVAKHEQAPQDEPSDEEIDAIAASMPDGAGGMLKQWGYRQFARALLARYGTQPAASAEYSQFLTDVMTAAGLVSHGKQCKALGERLGAGAMKYRLQAPAASVESDREKLMRAIVEAGQSAGIIRSDLETVSVSECLHILECLSKPAASAEQVDNGVHCTGHVDYDPSSTVAPNDPLPPPGVHAAVHYAGWLRREAYRHQEPKASVLRKVASMLDVLKAECGRLHQELIDAQALQQDADPCPQCIPGGVCKTPTCGRLLAARAQSDDARDAARWRHVERIARKNTAYDRYGDGAHWSVGLFSNDSRQTFGEAIDAAMSKEGKQ